MLLRLDAELVRRKLARSREHAQEMIINGFVLVDGVVSNKSSRQVSNEISIVVRESQNSKWVSRGAIKLLSALEAFEDQGFTINNEVVLDAGASTGGFTQVCLEKGAEKVIAVDVGYGQLAWQLRQDPKVENLERTNIRFLKKVNISQSPSRVVSDLSFISLKTVLPALCEVGAPNVQMLLMVKPQFEVGREFVGDGVVKEPELRKSAVTSVIEAAQALGLGLRGVKASGLPGPSGNVEYFVWLQRGEVCKDRHEIEALVSLAIEEGPQ
jgi:23S rRNA (cytidine1920-2'-O)/16S rRNA (cytidine1409-2'-O)-methyltransferase